MERVERLGLDLEKKITCLDYNERREARVIYTNERTRKREVNVYETAVPERLR